MSLLSASKPSPTSWAGTDAVEREFHNVREPLVSIYLDGIQGISRPVPDNAHRLYPRDRAEAALEKARKTLRWMEDQKAAPRGRARRYQEHTVTELRRLLGQAEAVYRGGPQKMDAASYRAYRASLGVR